MSQIKKVGIQSSEELREDLECPVCFKIPRTTPIYQCDQGHIHCKTCHPRLETCPVCRRPIGNIRSLVLEKVISKLPVQCINTDNGCHEPQALPEKMIQHEKICHFRIVKCILTPCQNSFILSDVVNHLKKKHPEIQLDKRSSAKIACHFDEDQTSRVPTSKILSPILLSFDNRYFLVCKSIDDRGYFEIKVFLVGALKEAKKFSCVIKAHSESNHSEAMFKGFVSDIEEKPERIAPCLLMHPNQIKEMANEENRLLLDIDIISKEEEAYWSDQWNQEFLTACHNGFSFKVLNQITSSKRKNFNVQDKGGNNGFILACHGGHIETVKCLFVTAREKQIDFNQANHRGETGFYLACRDGHADIVKLILSRSQPYIDLNARNYLDKATTPLMIACANNHLEIVKLMIDASVSYHIEIKFNARDHEGQTAFHYACRCPNGKVIIDLLVGSNGKIGLDILSTNNDGFPGLYYCKEFKNRPLPSTSSDEPRTKRNRIVRLK